MTNTQLLTRVKAAVREIEPDADILLFGSQGRKQAKQDSDWDFLILVNGPVNALRTRLIRRQLYEVEWDTGEVLCSIIRNRKTWNSPRMQATSFYKNVSHDGVAL